MEYNISDLPREVATSASAREPPTEYRVVLLLIAVPLITVTVVGNLMIMLAWIADARVRTPSNAYLASLALVDFLVGAIGMTLGLKYNYEGRWTMGVGTCQFFHACMHSTIFVGSVHLVLIALDRHRIVFEGVSYIQDRTYNGVVQCVLASWAGSLWIIIPIVIDWEHVGFDPEVKVHCLLKSTILGTFYWCTLLIVFPGVLMVWLYTRIYFEMKRRWRLREVSKQVIIPDSSGQTSTTGETGAKLNKTDPRSAQQKEKRAFVTLGILIGIFFVCWSPYGFTLLARAAGVNVPRALPVILASLGWVNSAVNPIVYAVRIAKYREAFKLILSPIHKCK